MVHVSTDAVFDGLIGGYRETDIPNPLHVYGKTKLEGEQAVTQAYPGAVIVRVNFYGWSLGGKRSLAEFFFNNLSEGRQVKGFTDVLFCPLQVNDLAEILLEMGQNRLGGLYHAASPECLSKFAFGQSIARRFGFREDMVIPVSWKDGGLVAARSPNLTLNVDKVRAALDRALPGQVEGLERFYQEYQDGLPAIMRNELQRT
jgi:dTDP-4-dehydrorhamnose reductase